MSNYSDQQTPIACGQPTDPAMSKLGKTIKIKHEGEVRKLKDVKDYGTFLHNLTNKMKIDPETIELAYYDEDGDEVSISTSADFEACLAAMGPKVPKIFIKVIEEADPAVDLDREFKNIDMTVSTVERPPVRSSNDEDLESEEGEDDGQGASTYEQFSIINSKIEDSTVEKEQESVPASGLAEILRQKREEKSKMVDCGTQDDSQQKEEHKATLWNLVDSENKNQPEEIEAHEEEKLSSPNNAPVMVNSSAVQTQDTLNANASTDVENLAKNNDQIIGTEPLTTQDQSNQKEVLFKESAVDPIPTEVSHRSINTMAVQNSDKVCQSKVEKPVEMDADLDEKLAAVVQTQFKEQTPFLLQECQKFIKEALSEKRQENINQPIHDTTCKNCGVRPIYGIRYECTQ